MLLVFFNPKVAFIRELKKFDIIGGKNRNRKKRFGLRVGFIIGLDRGEVY
jgi:hypothetical protein